MRRQAGQEAYLVDFIGDSAHRLIFFDAPPWAFTLLYLAFGAAVAAAFVLVPPRLRRGKGGDGLAGCSGHQL